MDIFRGRARSPMLSAVGLVALLTAGACGSNPGPSVRSDDAAATIASAYSLPADQEACLEKAFRSHPAATRPLASDQPATDLDLLALGAVEDGCIQVSTLAQAITSGAADSFGTLDEQQRTCLDDAVTALSDDDRVTLLVGLVVPRSLGDTWGIELGRVTNGILDACRLSATDLAGPTAPTVPAP